MGSADRRDAWLDNITLSKAFLEEANFNCAALGGADLRRGDLLDATFEDHCTAPKIIGGATQELLMDLVVLVRSNVGPRELTPRAVATRLEYK